MNNMKRLVTLFGAAALLIAVILFGVWFFRDRGRGRLVWERPIVRKTIQTFAYKVYGKSNLEDGRYFMSKVVFRNTGTKPVSDFSVSYQVRGYLDWTTPEVLTQIPPGHTIVKCFYPQFPMKVTEIKNSTPSALEIKIRWNDGRGAAHEEVLREEFTFRGLNEVEYTDMPTSERVAWRDNFASCQLLAAMVTPNDPVVAEYAAAVTGKLAGAVAGAGGDKEKIEVMAGLYYYMMETGMRYAGTEAGVEMVGDTVTTVQTVRMPRDVILNNNGLCIELTLVWASVLERLGINSLVFMVPGHAFIVVPLDKPINGIRYLPFECTAITPKAVSEKGPVPFDKAYQMALQTFVQALNAHKYIPINAQALHRVGIQPPELPNVNIDEVKRIIYTRNVPTIKASPFSNTKK
jgi:hypothetical protein